MKFDERFHPNFDPQSIVRYEDMDEADKLRVLAYQDQRGFSFAKAVRFVMAEIAAKEKK